MLMPVTPKITKPPVPVVKDDTLARVQRLVPDVNPELIRQFIQRGGQIQILQGIPRGNGYYSLPYSAMGVNMPDRGTRSSHNTFVQRHAPLLMGRVFGNVSGVGNTLQVVGSRVPGMLLAENLRHELYHVYQRTNPFMRWLSAIPGQVPFLNRSLVERPAYGSQWQSPLGVRFTR